MRFVLCLVIAALLPASAFAANEGTMSIARAHAAAAKGDQKAAAAVATTTDQATCLSGCASRGHGKGQCATACRPGLCHPNGETPYCVAD
jgi:hypothetical protein